MKKTLMCATAAAAFASAGLAANAEGWYTRADAQYSFDGKVDHDAIASQAGKLAGDSEVNESYGGGLGFGYGFSNGLRFEAALGYRAGDLDATRLISGTLPGTTVNPRGYAAVTDLMLNGIYDFNSDGTVQPYIGAGIGGARIKAKVANRVTGTGSNLNARNGFSDEATGIAYQALAGIGFQMTERLALDLGYKFFVAEDLDFAGNHGRAGYTVDYQDHVASLGLRFQFGAAPPPPPPPPPPTETLGPVGQQCAALSQEFVVYFEWDRADLTSQAAAVIDQAVANIASGARCAVGSVTIVGHTDTSGSSAYNDRLSVRRANVVADALTSRGISAALINRAGRGENELAKPTRDGVREPLNRRSEVRIIVQ